MEETKVMPKENQRSKKFYIFTGLGVIVALLMAAAAVYFHKEIQESAQAYGYAGVFVIGLLCGISIIPVPTLLLAFTMGQVLNPLYVGLVAGLGGGIGGITVYLTGAGVMHIGSRFIPTIGSGDKVTEDDKSLPTRIWAKIQKFYDKLLRWVGGKQGSWALFIISAMIISPFYPAALAAGSLGMKLWRFFLITWAGKTVRYIAVAYAGYYGLNALLNWIS